MEGPPGGGKGGKDHSPWQSSPDADWHWDEKQGKHVNLNAGPQDSSQYYHGEWNAQGASQRSAWNWTGLTKHA
eukprot:5431350-Heterocapsa_arctica.AAC.1